MKLMGESVMIVYNSNLKKLYYEKYNDQSIEEAIVERPNKPSLYFVDLFSFKLSF